MFFSYHPKLVQRMVKETPKTIVGLSILSIIYLLIYKTYIPNTILIIWVIAQSIFIYFRFINARILANCIKKDDVVRTKIHVKYFYGLLIYSAFVWNFGAIIGLHYAQEPYEFISLALIMGIITAGTMSLSSIFKAYLLYFFLMLIPQLVVIYQYHDAVHNAILLLSLIYIPFILMLSRSINKNLISHIEDNEALVKNVEKIHKISITDTLTQINNRHYFFDTAEKMIALSRREEKNVSLLMMDIDHFKVINDTYGHQVGDVVLKSFAHKVQEISRNSDLFARVGGEEFAILLYDVNNDSAQEVARNICKTIAFNDFSYKEITIEVTVSIGVATIKKGSNTLDELYEKADLKLYEAKNNGRNCIS